jgi:hypothetical protein
MEQAVHTQNAPVLDQQAGAFSSFSLQLVQRTLEETLGAVQKSIHEDVRNLHIDLIRQFHMQEVRKILFYFIHRFVHCPILIISLARVFIWCLFWLLVWLCIAF